MLESFFQGVFDTQQTPVIAPGAFLLCIAASIGLGLLLCLTTLWRTRCTKSFAVTLALLPAVVCVVIMMVNGNVGTGVAVAGAFSLVRFRSAPGSAREIGAIFIAMGTGLMTGMGYLGYALVFVLILGGMTCSTPESTWTIRSGTPAGVPCTSRFRKISITQAYWTLC